MKAFSDRVRPGVSVGLSLLLLTSSAAVPLMERFDFGPAPVVESEHTPGECPAGHDHRICTQVGANLSIASGGEDASLGGQIEPAVTFTSLSGLPGSGPNGVNRSRAPPPG